MFRILLLIQRRDGCLFFTKEIDFTDSKKLAALANIGNYWKIDFWFIWIYVEWWDVFEVPIEVNYKNENLTSFEPKIVVSGVRKEDAVSIKENKPGEVKLQLADGGKIEVKPRVELLGESEVYIKTNEYVIEGNASHNSLDYQLKVNGKEKELNFDINKENGAFKFNLKDLTEGANFVQLYYKTKEDKNFEFVAKKTIYAGQASWWNENKLLIIIAAAILIIVAALIFIFVSNFIKNKKL